MAREKTDLTLCAALKRAAAIGCVCRWYDLPDGAEREPFPACGAKHDEMIRRKRTVTKHCIVCGEDCSGACAAANPVEYRTALEQKLREAEAEAEEIRKELRSASLHHAEQCALLKQLPQVAKMAKPGLLMNALIAVLNERVKQARRWTEEHDDAHVHHDWIAIIGSYANLTSGAWDPDAFQKSMVRVAALAIAAIEWKVRGDHRQLTTTPLKYACGCPEGEACTCRARGGQAVPAEVAVLVKRPCFHPDCPADGCHYENRP